MNDPQLPAIDVAGRPGGLLVRRAVPVVLTLLGVLIVATFLLGYLVEIRLGIRSQGVLEPETIYPIRSQESGVVADIYVTTGDTLEAGDAILELRSFPLETEWRSLTDRKQILRNELSNIVNETPYEMERTELNVRQAEMRLLRSRAEAVRTLSSLGIFENLDSVMVSHERGTHVVIDRTIADVGEAQLDLEVNRNLLDRLRLRMLREQQMEADAARVEEQIAVIEERLQSLTVRSTVEAIVLTERLDLLKNSYIEAGSTLAELGSLGMWRVTSYLSQQEVEEVTVGNAAIMELRAGFRMTRRKYEGNVVSISLQPGQPNTQGGGLAGLYTVVIAPTDDSLRELNTAEIRRGFLVETHIITGRNTIWRILMSRVLGIDG